MTQSKMTVRMVVWAGFLLACTGAFAQGRGPGGGGGMGGGMPHGGGLPSMGRPGGDFPGTDRGGYGGTMSERPPNTPAATGTLSTMRGGLQLGPPGRWWDDKSFARSLNLRKDQQKRMDAIFNANKSAILESYKTLQGQESRLEAATREPKLDEARIFAAIDGVNQARSALEKANAHMLLQVRGEMDQDQVQMMDKFREKSADDTQP